MNVLLGHKLPLRVKSVKNKGQLFIERGKTYKRGYRVREWDRQTEIEKDKEREKERDYQKWLWNHNIKIEDKRTMSNENNQHKK